MFCLHVRNTRLAKSTCDVKLNYHKTTPSEFECWCAHFRLFLAAPETGVFSGCVMLLSV